jgi:hypothetical protein
MPCQNLEKVEEVKHDVLRGHSSRGEWDMDAEYIFENFVVCPMSAEDKKPGAIRT